MESDPVLTIMRTFMRLFTLRSFSKVNVACFLVLMVLIGCSPGNFYDTDGPDPENPIIPPPTGTGVPIWVGSWGDAINNNDAQPDNNGGNSRSFRFLITPTIGGTEERVRFSNYFGTTPVVIGSARLSVGKDGSAAVDPLHDVALSFSGQPGATIAPGAMLVSDPVNMTFSFGEILDISVYLPGNFGPVARHPSLFIKNWTTADGAGDVTANTDGTQFTQTMGEWLLINGVDVYGQYDGTLALFGSSTTDGNHSNYSDTHTYPGQNVPLPHQHDSRLSDWIAKRLNRAGYRIGVVNLGISGDTVTNDVENQTLHIQNANQRIGHDVLTLPNLIGMITYFGSIDIRSADCKSAPEIEQATMQMVATAHAAKLPVMLATIPPSAFCTTPGQANYGPSPSLPDDPYAGGVIPGPANGGELQRLAFNAWIRTVGRNLPGVVQVADFEAALADPARVSFLQSQYNSGDNYHPDGLGYHREAQAVPFYVLPQPPK